MVIPNNSEVKYALSGEAWEFPKISGPYLGPPVARVVVSWGLFLGLPVHGKPRLWGLYRALIKVIVGSTSGVLTVAHMGLTGSNARKLRQAPRRHDSHTGKQHLFQHVSGSDWLLATSVLSGETKKLEKQRLLKIRDLESTSLVHQHVSVPDLVVDSGNAAIFWFSWECATKQGLLHFMARHTVHVRLFWDKVSEFFSQVPSKAPALWEQHCVLKLSELPACLADAVMWSAA